MTATISLFISSDILSILYPAISVAILLDGERLEDIALLNIVELCKSYAALKVLRDLLDIVLETAQGRNLVLGDDDAVTEDEIASLKRFKDDAKEVAEGYECGVTLAKFADVKEGDVYEAFKMEEYRD